MKKEYSNLNYKFLSADTWSPDQLLDTLRRVVPEETGILFASWFHKRMFAGNMLMMANSYKVIANSTLPCPFFALSSSISSIEEDGTIIGGCVYDMNLYCEEIVKMINAVAVENRHGISRIMIRSLWFFSTILIWSILACLLKIALREPFT